MADIMERSKGIYEARDKSQGVMLGLKDQADRKHIDFELEWSALGQLLEKDHKMKDHIANKEQERSLKVHDPIEEEENRLRTRVTKHAWGIAKDKANIHLSMEKVQDYEEAFAKIQKATSITDVDE